MGETKREGETKRPSDREIEKLKGRLRKGLYSELSFGACKYRLNIFFCPRVPLPRFYRFLKFEA